MELNTICLYSSMVFLKCPFVNLMITAHTTIYNIFGRGIYHKTNSTFKSEPYEFHNRNIGIFSGNSTKMAGYFMGISRDLCIQKVLQAKINWRGKL